MRLIESIAGYARDDDGAVTVDWVALCAALVLIGVGLAVTINGSTLSFANEIAADVDSRGVMTF